MKRGDKAYLIDILDSAKKIEEFTRSMSCEEFLQDERTQSAVERKLEIIGEAVKRISLKVKRRISRSYKRAYRTF